jgi:hypothetical protein
VVYCIAVSSIKSRYNKTWMALLPNMKSPL